MKKIYILSELPDGVSGNMINRAEKSFVLVARRRDCEETCKMPAEEFNDMLLETRLKRRIRMV